MARNLLRAQFANQPPVLTDKPLFGTEQQQLVGCQVDGCPGGNVFTGEVEDLSPVGE